MTVGRAIAIVGCAGFGLLGLVDGHVTFSVFMVIAAFFCISR